MSDFVGLDVTGIEEISAKLRDLPDAVADEGVEAVNEYLINSFRQYPAKKSITLQQAYGGFRSAKQRRFFFAALRDGRITVPYKRTQTLSSGWKQIGEGRTSFVANETEYAHWVQPETNGQQANMMRLIGWKSLDNEIKERITRIVEKFDASVKKAIRKVGLK